jgi:hypothetical protein
VTTPDYVNLFGEQDQEPGVIPRKEKRPPAEPRIEPAFVVGAVRYERMVVAWVEENGPSVAHAVTAKEVRDLVCIPRMVEAVREDPSIPGERTRKAPHVRGSATSEAAAATVTRKLAGKRLAVLTEFLFLRAELTDNELTERFTKPQHGWSSHTARPRRIELVRDGWLEDSGERRNGSIVWRPTAKAWAWWNQQQNGGG